jgi:hypothetical protein
VHEGVPVISRAVEETETGRSNSSSVCNTFMIIVVSL